MTQIIQYVSSTGNLKFKPSTDFSGTVTVTSVKHFVSGASTALSLTNSDGSDGLELRAGGSGLDNSFVGYGAGWSNTTGAYNAAFGGWALDFNTTGGNNSAVGYNALASNTTGNYNTAIGSLALANNITGRNNEAFGFTTLGANINGDENTAMGSGALSSNTSGSDNVAMGLNALGGNTTGYVNTAIGPWALESNTTGSFNTAMGTTSMQNNIDGTDNTAYGELSLQNNTSGVENTAVGDAALASNMTGGHNTALGAGAGLDDGNFVTLSDLDNATMLGAYAQAQSSNTLILGGADDHAVNVGIGTTSPTNLFSISPVVYTTGQASMSGATITGSGTSWASSGTPQPGMEFIFANGDKYTISTVNNNTSITATTTGSESSQDYRIHNPAFYVSSTGDVETRTSTNSTTAFRIQNAANTSLLTADTTNSTITIAGTTTTFANLILSEAHFKVTQTNKPTIGTFTNCGTGSPSGTVTNNSARFAGQITITTGTTPTNCSAVISFNKAYGAAPKSVLVTPADFVFSPNGTSRTVSVTATATGSFTIMMGGTSPSNTTAYKFYYWVIE